MVTVPSGTIRCRRETVPIDTWRPSQTVYTVGGISVSPGPENLTETRCVRPVRYPAGEIKDEEQRI